MKQTFDVAIIGGGIIGCAIAYYLSKEKVKVVVLERNQVGGKTTKAAAGMLGAHSECHDLGVFFPFARSSQAEYRTLQHELKDTCGIDINLKTGGILKLAYTEKERKELLAIASLPSVRWLNSPEVHSKATGVSPTIIGAAYFEDDVSVLPESTCLAFRNSAQLHGAVFMEHTCVHSFKKQGNSTILTTTQGNVTAANVVVASGVWSGAFGFIPSLNPVKGECIAVHSESIPLKHTLFHDHSYIMPRNDGKLVIGATMVENDWSDKPTLGGMASLISKAVSMLPAVADMKIDSYWAGLRPQTFDQKPFIGAHPDEKGIYFAAGHFRNGILLAPATAKMIRDLLLERPVEHTWKNAFTPDRQIPTTI